MSEKLMYCTVRLEFSVPGGTRSGTGFFFDFFKTESNSTPAIVSNAHVFGDSDQVQFKLTLADKFGSPRIGSTHTINVTDLQKTLIRLPDTDLAIIPFGPILLSLKNDGIDPVFTLLNQAIIPTEEQYLDLSPLENVATIGYPGMLWDDVNNIPIFHRGYTATPPYINFKGKKEFMVDFATWPGASGSPMFLMNEGTIYNARSESTSIGGTRILLLGVVYGVAVQEVTGEVVLQQAPTKFDATALRSSSRVPTNLGACIRADKILEFEPLLIRRGVRVPPGYVVRAKT